jgi:hypothetical protein
MTAPCRLPLDPPEELTALRERQPISRMAYPDGHMGWLVGNQPRADPHDTGRPPFQLTA